MGQGTSRAIKSKISGIISEETKESLKRTISVHRVNASYYTELAFISQEEFEGKIKELNAVLKVSCKSSPVRVCFMASCCSNFNWKVLSKVACFQVTSDGSILLSRLLSVVKFWKLRNEILHRINDDTASEKFDEFQFVDVEPVEEVHGSDTCTQQQIVVRTLSTSQVFESIDAVSSEVVECCICMDRKSDVSLPCAHCFCKECTMSWSQIQGENRRSCPICRQQFAPGDEFWEMADAPDDEELQHHLISLASGI